MARTVGAASNLGLWMMVAGAVGGTINGIFDYFSGGNGIHGTWGCLGVLVASAPIALFSLLLALRLIRPGWLRGVLFFLLLIGILATAFCAYLLEANSLVGLMAFALLGWLDQLLRQGVIRRTATIGTGAA